MNSSDLPGRPRQGRTIDWILFLHGTNTINALHTHTHSHLHADYFSPIGINKKDENCFSTAENQLRNSKDIIHWQFCGFLWPLTTQVCFFCVHSERELAQHYFRKILSDQTFLKPCLCWIYFLRRGGLASDLPVLVSHFNCVCRSFFTPIQIMIAAIMT